MLAKIAEYVMFKFEEPDEMYTSNTECIAVKFESNTGRIEMSLAKLLSDIVTSALENLFLPLNLELNMSTAAPSTSRSDIVELAIEILEPLKESSSNWPLEFIRVTCEDTILNVLKL